MADNKNFSEVKIDNNPFRQFEKWYKEHLASGIAIPDSVSLGTVSDDRNVSLRTVLMKDYDENGFVFFTNYNSRKGSDLSSNPGAALLFYWSEASRQVRIEGVVHKISQKESEIYFHSRPRESQLSAWASDQSSVIPDRKHLEKRYAFFQSKFKNKLITKPEHWGGFRLVPRWFEFWQEGPFRLHDRVSYTRKNDIWIIERLAP